MELRKLLSIRRYPKALCVYYLPLYGEVVRGNESVREWIGYRNFLMLRLPRFMHLALLAAVVAGCEKAIEIPPAGVYLPELCAVVGVIGGEAAPQPTPDPPPAPAPAPSGKCENCNGTGKLGDGRVAIVCPVCDGTGKVTKDGGAEVYRRYTVALLHAFNQVADYQAKAAAGNAKLKELDAEVVRLKAATLKSVEAVPIVHKVESVWETSLKAAREKATKEGKPMLVHWYADWCGPCRNMERQVLSQPRVQAALADIVVAVKADADADKARTKAWSVNELPKDMVVSPDYKKRIDLPLTIDPDKYVRQVTKAAAEVQAYIDADKDSINVRPVTHEVVREVILERPVYYYSLPPAADAFPPGYRGGGGPSCSGGSCSSGSCGMGFW